MSGHSLLGNGVMITAGVTMMAVGIYKAISTTKDERRAGRYYLVAALVAMGVSAVGLAPLVGEFVANKTPMPNLGRLVGSAAAMTGAWCVYRANGGPVRARQRWLGRTLPSSALLVMSVVAMAALLIGAGVPFAAEFGVAYGTHPLVAGYEAVFSAYLGWVLAEFVWVVRPYLRQLQGMPRLGLRIITVGVFGGALWAVWKLTNTIIRILTGNPIPAEGGVSGVIAGFSLLIVGGGLTVRRWGAAIAAPAQDVRFCIYGMVCGWFADELARIRPDVAQGQPDMPLVRAVRVRGYSAAGLFRDVQHDVRRRIAPGADERLRELCTARGHKRTEPEVEAARLVSGLEGYRQDRIYYEAGDAPRPYTVPADSLAELKAVFAVARAYWRSPVVQRIRTEASDLARIGYGGDAEAEGMEDSEDERGRGDAG